VDELARACERIAATNSRNRKAAILAAYLEDLSPEDRELAGRFLAGEPVPGAKLAVGGVLLREAVRRVTGWETDLIRLSMREVGDTGEAIGHLLFGRTENRPLPLAEAAGIYQRLAMARRTALKLDILAETFARYRPLAVKYFVKFITGSLRIGLQTKTVREPGLFRPMEFMLAKPYEQVTGFRASDGWTVEDKYDGIRAQAHIDRSEVRIFTRGLEEITAGFPDLTARLSKVPGRAILDGEILAWRDGRALSFAVLQQRIARKKVSAAILESVPVEFLAYDILLREDEWLLGTPIERRRELLRSLPVIVSPSEPLDRVESIESRFTAARDRGNEGLILKRDASVYEPGKRTGLWIKVKRAYGTLDVVITAAEQGHGRRATVLSDYTFAVRDGERLLNVGKAYSGLTDAEIRELTRILRGITTERFGRVALVRPEVVLEVAFDGVQKSPRHKSGYALRFPRILRWRRDKTAAEIDSLEAVRSLYEASLPA
jgi:DNA ligase-1